LVKETWQEPENWGASKIQNEHAKLAKEQIDLEAFVFANFKNADKDIREVALWMFFMVYRMYRKAYGKPIPRIKSKSIISKHNSNIKIFESLVTAHDIMLERIAETHFTSQPEVWRYVTEALLENDENDDVELKEDAIGEIFLLFKTIIELLDEITNTNLQKPNIY
jgi:hypothetical protein